jgi:hypothetical protein
MVDTVPPEVNRGVTPVEPDGVHVERTPDKKPETLISSPNALHRETAHKIATYTTEALGVPVAGQEVIAHPAEEAHPEEAGAVGQVGGEWIERARNVWEQDVLRTLNGSNESGSLDLVHEGQNPTPIAEKRNRLREAAQKLNPFKKAA